MEGGAQTGTVISYVALGAAQSTSPNHSLVAAWASFTDALARPGGGSWTLSDLSSLNAGTNRIAGNGPMYCTSLWIIVDYTPPAAGLFFKLFRCLFL